MFREIKLPDLARLFTDSRQRKKATIHQVTTMLATSKNVLFLGHNNLLTTDADDPSVKFPPLLTLGR